MEHEASANEHEEPAVEADESSPLLSAPPDEGDDHAVQDTEQPRSPSYPRALVFIFVLSFVADFGSSMVTTPEVRLLEMAVCRDYYLQHDPSVIGPPSRSYVDETLCKVEAIQVDLAYLMALKSLLMTLPGLVLTIPYARLTDKIGRRPVAFRGMLGQIMSYFWIILVCYFHQVFPVRLALLSPLFLIIGGGSQVLTATMAAVITDVTPEDMRTTAFYLMGAGVLAMDILATPVGFWLLAKDLWLPFKLSVPIVCLSLPLVYAMPETLGCGKNSSENDQRHDEAVETSRSACPLVGFLYRRYRHALRTVQGLDPRIVPKQMTVCFVILFVTTFARMASIIFVPFTSNLLGWPISKAGYLLGVKSLITFCTLVILAIVTQIIERATGTRPLRLDLWVLRSSLALLVAGGLLIAASKGSTPLIVGSVFSSAGNGIVQALQGLLAKYSDASSRAQLFGSAALLQLLAQLTGSLVFPKLFAIGLGRRESKGMGLPFYFSSALYVFATVLSFLIPTL